VLIGRPIVDLDCLSNNKTPMQTDIQVIKYQGSNKNIHLHNYVKLDM